MLKLLDNAIVPLKLARKPSNSSSAVAFSYLWLSFSICTFIYCYVYNLMQI